MSRRLTRAWALGFAFYTLLAALFAIQRVALYSSRGEPVGPNGILLTFLGIYTWAALTPIILWVSRRFPLGRGCDRRRSLLAHLVAMPCVIAVDIGVYALLDHFLLDGLGWGAQPPSLMAKFLALFAWGAPGDVLWYGGVVAVGHALTYRDLSRERELSASQVERRLAEARLQVLKMQLQPHFLFNTLNSISALVHDDPVSAKRMLARLGELLRRTLEKDAEPEVPLREELKLLDSYLDIQRTRFEDRLSVHWEIAPEALEARVPNMILQPLVENAVRHGIAQRDSRGRIEIRARRRNGYLELEVRDDGMGLPSGSTAFKEGVGLANTRERLQQLYGSHHRFELVNAAGGGLIASLQLPYGEEPNRRERLERMPLGSGAPRRETAQPFLFPRTWRSWAAILGAWLVFGVSLIGQSLFLTMPEGKVLQVERFYLLGYQSAAWALFTGLILRLCSRYPLGRGRWRRNLAVHLGANALLVCGGTALLVAVDAAFGWVSWDPPVPPSLGQKYARAATSGFLDYMFRYWLVMGIAHALGYRRLFRERELRASELGARLADAELQILTVQLQPEFLLDTLRSIAARVDADPRAADRMLIRLGDLLRLVLDHDGRQVVTLREELAALDPYLKIQQMLRRERLRVRLNIAPETSDARVPNLILQSLVEHTLATSLARDPDDASIALRARLSNGNVELQVRHGRGAGRSSGWEAEDTSTWPWRTRSALENTRQRLQQLYGSEHRFELRRDERGRLRLTLEMPYDIEADSGEAAVRAALANAT